ncbi:IucA/IucC family siderophore biosynthesis protein [Bdellovibrio bacteriovorus]|uniref:IucA/IucC family protein n=1 Tax=Bdellovibrio bacteriovorus TaxID=959 RepID=UPI0035A5A179
MSNFQSLALKHTISCFFNSLFREYQNYSYQNISAENAKVAIVVDVPEKGTVLIPLAKKSLLGRHEYQGDFLLKSALGTEAISFETTVDLILDLLCQHWNEPSEKKSIFVDRLKNSLHNMELSLKARYQDLKNLYSQKISFEQAEQGLMIGHNFHPYPKMREGFDDKDFEIYSPEMGGHFGLHWFFAKPEILHLQKAASFTTSAWTKMLFESEVSSVIPEGMIPFPVHPWQAQHLLKNEAVQSYLKSGQLVDAILSTPKTWYPTSSLRSVYSRQSPYMLKFSLTLRLTNSIRHLTDVEVVRGLQVYDVMNTATGQQFRKEHPQFEIIFEPAFAALKNQQGGIISESIVVCRENPFQKEEAALENIVVSTLAQDNPLGGETLIWQQVEKHAGLSKVSLAKASEQWFQQYLHVALKPFVAAQSEYGVLLGAHQQNMILQIKDGLPVKAYFRDCQGTGYSEHGFKLFHQDVASLTRENGNVLDNKGNILFAYYLLVNSTWNVMAALSHPNGVTEERLLEMLIEFMTSMNKPTLPDSSFLDYVLKEARIYQKGNFICSLQNLNENTAANPLAIYNLIDNPLATKKTETVL